MSDAEARELYLLRRYCQISAHDALHVVPLWEQHVLLTGIDAELRRAQEV